jgi:phage tail sheath protein FI
MPTYQTPGVYIEEVAGQMKPIEGVATSVAAFVGLATGGPVNTPTKVTSWAEYQRVFGDPALGAFHPEAFMPQAVYGYFLNGGNNAWIVRVGRNSHGGRPYAQLPSSIPDVNAYEVVVHPEALARADAQRNPPRDPGKSKAANDDIQKDAKTFRLEVGVKIIPQEGDPEADPPTGPTLSVDVTSNLPVPPTREQLEAVAAQAMQERKVAAAQRAVDDTAKAETDAKAAVAAAEAAAKEASGKPEADDKAAALKRAQDDASAATAAAAAAVKDQKDLTAAIKAAPEPGTEVATIGADLISERHEPLTMTPGIRGFVSTVNSASELIEIVPTGGLYSSAELQLKEAEIDLTLRETAVPDKDNPRELPEEKVKASELAGDDMRQTGLAGIVLADEVTMVCVPDLMSLQRTDDDIRGVQGALATFCANSKRMAILDPPPGLTNQEIAAWRASPNTPSTPFATLYWPWLDVLDANGTRIHVPPCGHVAGVWARTDGTRGVHKAPANEDIRGVVGLGFDVTSVAQGELNAASINCIRGFKGRGTRIWGARTLSADPEYKYVNVRRLVNYISASLLNGTQWSVFEPNDEVLWGQLQVSVSAFLTGVWRSGALFGSTPDQAFFVKCDADTNPPDLVALGQVNVQIGVAPVKPAEFVIFQISQFQPGAA